jgi:putative ABC transport system permease protein
MRWPFLVDELAANLRHGVRQIARSPGFTAVAVLTLALGIGANTALFSIFNSLILRPLPGRDPDSLALLSDGSWSYPIWNEIKARESELFDGALAWAAQRFDLSAGGQTEPVDGAYVSGQFFDVLGVTAIRGRLLMPADDGGALTATGVADGPVAVISHRRVIRAGRRGWVVPSYICVAQPVAPRFRARAAARGGIEPPDWWRTTRAAQRARRALA